MKSSAKPALDRHAFWAGALLIGVTLLAYAPALRGGFIWDDDTFLTKNALIKAGDGLYRFWFTTQASDYWPVTSSSLWVEWRLWGMQAFGYHATNLALHVGSALLLWAILKRLRMPGAYLAAFLFAVHPVNVESVAWIAQRKNLMAMVLYLASIWCFLKPGRKWQVLSLGAFTLAMLSKGSVAFLPLVLLGLIAWDRRLTLREALRTAPFFLVAGILTVTDIWFQRHGTTAVFRHAGPVDRVLGAGAVIWFYLSKALLPLKLIFVYPQWRIDAANPLWWLPLLAALALTWALWRHRQRGARPALFAWGYFCVALIPVMGFTDVYFMKYSLVADHYQHLALIAVVALVAGKLEMGRRKAETGLGDRRFRLPPSAFQFSAAIIIAALSCLTWRQCRMYRDAETLYRTTIADDPESPMPHNNLGDILSQSDRLPAAIAEYEEALRLNPDLFDVHYNLGVAFTKTGRAAQAIAQFEQAIRLNPDFTPAHNDLGVILTAAGRPAEAIPHYEQILRLAPGDAVARYNLGNALQAIGRVPEAIAQYREALRLKSDYAPAWYNLGIALAGIGRVSEAIDALERTLRLQPDDANAHYILGQILCGIGQNEEGMAQLRQAEKLKAGQARDSGSGF